MKKNVQSINDMLIDFLDSSPSNFHAVRNLTGLLEDYVELKEDEKWKLSKGKNYYVKRKDSSLIAFKIPKEDFSTIRMASAHSDSPTFKVKTVPEITVDDQYLKLNTEVYGSAILYSWFDRPLSVAGRVVVKDKDEFKSILVNVDEDLLIIPSVAIHMIRDINDGYKFNLKTDTLPLMGKAESKGEMFNLISKNAGVDEADILGYDLYLYPREKAKIWGIDQEFISAHALDDLQCAFALVKGLNDSSNDGKTLSLACVFDNEEVGSLTGQGADSTFLEDVLNRINSSLGYDDEHLKMAIGKGFCVSADNAHSVHPNHTEFADATNKPYMNEGIVIKFNASQKYTTDAFTEAMFRDICKRADVPVQTYANRSDMPGGSTLGNLSMRHISIKTVDVGLPQLAMHSCYETAGAKDTEYLVKAMRVFYGG